MREDVRKFAIGERDYLELDERRFFQLSLMQRHHVAEVNARAEMHHDNAARLDPSDPMAATQLEADYVNDQLQLERTYQGDLIRNDFGGTATAILAASWIRYLYNRLTDRRDDLRKLQAPPADSLARIRRQSRR